MFSTVTLASGMEAPDWSATFPLKLAVVNCPARRFGTRRGIAKVAMNNEESRIWRLMFEFSCLISSRPRDNIRNERSRATSPMYTVPTSVMGAARVSVLVSCAWLASLLSFAQVPPAGDAAPSLKARARALMDQGRIKEAVATFREALKSVPHDTDILNDLGVALRKDGDLTGSLAALEHALGLRQDDARIHSNFALTLRAMGHLDQAIAAMQKASRLAPHDSTLRRNLGVLLTEADEDERAETELRSAADQAPADRKSTRLNYSHPYISYAAI